MSRPIILDPLECPACKARNKVISPRPKMYKPAKFHFDCEQCDSKILLLVKHVPHKTHVAWEYLDVQINEEGRERVAAYLKSKQQNPQ